MYTTNNNHNSSAMPAVNVQPGAASSAPEVQANPVNEFTPSQAVANTTVQNTTLPVSTSAIQQQQYDQQLPNQYYRQEQAYQSQPQIQPQSHATNLHSVNHQESSLHNTNTNATSNNRDDFTPNTSLYHQAKRALMGVKPEFDNDYLTLRHHHEEMSTVLTRLQSRFGRYTDLSRSNFNEGQAISKDLTSVLNDTNARYNGSVSTAADAHYEMAVSSSSYVAESLLNPQVRALTDESLSRCHDLGRRMKEHEEFKGEVDYYGHKVEKLRTEKSNLPPGTQKPKLDDRLDRNTTKYDQMHQKFVDAHSQLIRDLNDLWLNRAKILGPIYANFIAVEKEVSRRNFDILSTIDLDPLNNPDMIGNSSSAMPMKKSILSSEDIDHSVSGTYLDNDKHHSMEPKQIEENAAETASIVVPETAAALAPPSQTNEPQIQNMQEMPLPGDGIVPVDMQPPHGSEQRKSAPPIPPRPMNHLTLAVPMNTRDPGMTDDSPLTPPHEVPPYRMGNSSLASDNTRSVPASSSTVGNVEAQRYMPMPVSLAPLEAASQPLLGSSRSEESAPMPQQYRMGGEQQPSYGGNYLNQNMSQQQQPLSQGLQQQEGAQPKPLTTTVSTKEVIHSAGNSAQPSVISRVTESVYHHPRDQNPNAYSTSLHDQRVNDTEAAQPVRTLSDLIRKNSRSAAASSDLSKDQTSYAKDGSNYYNDKSENPHQTSESLVEQYQRQAAVFPQQQQQNQTQQAGLPSRNIEYI